MSRIQSYIVQYRDLPINTLLHLKKKIKVHDDDDDSDTKLLAIDIILRGTKAWKQRKTS